MTIDPSGLRTGIGTDVHALREGVEMHCAGLHFPDEPVGLAGHSDGDVAAHALCDALLGAAGLGDMGSNYGTREPRWAGASGVSFLTETARRLASAGWRPVNAGVQVIGQHPRMTARRAEAEEARRAAEADMFSDISLDAPVSLQEGETPTSLDDIQF